MANAKKCDRCGRLYENYEGVKITKGDRGYNAVIFTCTLYQRHFDLCPDCMTKLVAWIKQEE